MLPTRPVILLAALIAGGGLSALSLPQESPTFKVDVNLVNVLATVRDRSGHIVSNLSKDDFVLEEDGKRQEIKYFSRQTDLPLTIGLLVDTSMSQRNLITDERSASYQFFDQVLRPDRDQAFVIKFDSEVELLQDLTSSRARLQSALNALDVRGSFRRPVTNGGHSDRLGNSLGQSWPGGVPYPGGQRHPGRGSGQGRPGPGGHGRGAGGGTALFDSVFLASDEVLKQQEGRKAIVLISDGVDLGSKVSEKEAIEAAHRADVLVYSIRYYDPSAYGGRFGRSGSGGNQDAKGSTALETLSKETGGRMFEVTGKLTLKDIYDTIQEELRNQYSIGYTPSEGGDAGFRRISLRTTDGTLEVVTRSGYYARQSRVTGASTPQ
jgi:VWFA-related protein